MHFPSLFHLTQRVSVVTITVETGTETGFGAFGGGFYFLIH
jgi:hypothetical protein